MVVKTVSRTQKVANKAGDTAFTVHHRGPGHIQQLWKRWRGADRSASVPRLLVAGCRTGPGEEFKDSTGLVHHLTTVCSFALDLMRFRPGRVPSSQQHRRGSRAEPVSSLR